jgi:hypothetical protein
MIARTAVWDFLGVIGIEAQGGRRFCGALRGRTLNCAENLRHKNARYNIFGAN